MDECIFKTKLANVLIQVEDKSVIQICFTKRKIKLAKNSYLINAKKQVVEYIEGKRKIFTFKLDPKGTLYQKKSLERITENTIWEICLLFINSRENPKFS